MELILSFAAGVVACGLALPAISWLRGRIARYRQATDAEANQVTTVSQVLHLAVQGSPTALAVLDRNQEIVMSNPAAHEMSLVHDRAVNPDVWQTAQEVFEDKETRTVDLAIPKRRTGHRVTQFKAVIKPLTLNDGRFVIIYGTDELSLIHI